jgi:type VI secretion system protein ImpF
MAKPHIDRPLVPSVFDRLLDDEPTVARETVKTRSQALRELKESVRRDVENLLNTRWRCQSWPEDFDELELSLPNYGMPDISRADFRSAEGRERFRQIMERVIRHFEPRLQHVGVEMLEKADGFNPATRFRIEAMMYTGAAGEPVVFDLSLEPATGTVEVKGRN